MSRLSTSLRRDRAESDLGAVPEDHDADAAAGADLGDLVEANDGRPVDPQEAFRPEPRLHAIHGLADGVGGVVGVDADAVVRRLDPDDARDGDRAEPTAAAHGDAGVVGRHVVLAQERLHAARELDLASPADLVLGAGQHAGEALVVEGLQQVVERLRFEGAHGVLLERGREHHHRHAVGADAPDHVEAGRLGHLDVEEHEVDRLASEERDRLLSIPAFAGDLDLGVAAEERAQVGPCRRLVVDDQDAQPGRFRIAVHGVPLQGSWTRTRHPSPSLVDSSSRARSP